MQNFKDKLTNWVESSKGKDILTVLIVVLVGLASFGLGRLSKGPEGSGIQVEYPPELNPAAVELTSQAIKSNSSLLQKTVTSKIAQTGNFFASNRGSRYYPADCAAGQNLKIENRVYFDTRESAESAGYTLSSSCR